MTVALSLIATSSAGSRTSADHATPAGATWNLGKELLANARGAHANPFPDTYGNADVWHLMGASSTARTPSTYKDLAAFADTVCGTTGLSRWSVSDVAPEVMINTTNAAINGLSCAPSVKLAPSVANLHPGPAPVDVLVAWKSPISGTRSRAA